MNIAPSTGGSVGKNTIYHKGLLSNFLFVSSTFCLIFFCKHLCFSSTPLSGPTAFTSCFYFFKKSFTHSRFSIITCFIYCRFLLVCCWFFSWHYSFSLLPSVSPTSGCWSLSSASSKVLSSSYIISCASTSIGVFSGSIKIPPVAV